MEKEAKVITEGAYLSIDVTSMRPTYANSRRSIKEWSDEVFGTRLISATLINTSTGDQTKIYHRGGVSNTSTGFLLFARKSGGLETGKTYDKIIVETDVQLRGVTIRWTNWMM